MRATWNGTTIAESDDTVAVEGSHYSPAESVRGDLLAAATPLAIRSTPPWPRKVLAPVVTPR